MTPQEALKIRNNPTFADVDNDELSNCIDKALEKQIPKKAKNVSDDGIERYVCENCNNLMHRKKNYCDNCGQALDWSDDK